MVALEHGSFALCEKSPSPLSSFLLWRKNEPVWEWLAVSHCFLFIWDVCYLDTVVSYIMSFVSFGYKPDFIVLLCFYESSSLCLFVFDCICWLSSVFFRHFLPHALQLIEKIHYLSINPAATLQPKHCFTCLAWTLSMKQFSQSPQAMATIWRYIVW